MVPWLSGWKRPVTSWPAVCLPGLRAPPHPPRLPVAPSHWTLADGTSEQCPSLVTVPPAQSFLLVAEPTPEQPLTNTSVRTSASASSLKGRRIWWAGHLARGP